MDEEKNREKWIEQVFRAWNLVDVLSYFGEAIDSERAKELFKTEDLKLRAAKLMLTVEHMQHGYTYTEKMHNMRGFLKMCGIDVTFYMGYRRTK